MKQVHINKDEDRHEYLFAVIIVAYAHTCFFIVFSCFLPNRLRTSTLHRCEKDIERSQKAVDLVRGIIRAYACLFFVMLQWIPHHSLPRIQRIQNAECPTSMRVGNITPAAEIPCHIPTI